MESITNHIFFDLDNTLWDFDKNSHKALLQLCTEFDFDNKLNTDFESFHKFYLKRNEELWHLYYFNKIEKSELRYLRFYDSFKNFGFDDINFSKQISEAYINIAPHSTELKPGCIETLEVLHKKFPLHVITNGFTEIQHIKIDSCGLRKYFGNIIISEQYNSTKPNIEIFRVAEKLASTQKEKCVMIGDSIISDIEGAVGAGWKAIHYNEKDSIAKRDLRDLRDYREIRDLRELKIMF